MSVVKQIYNISRPANKYFSYIIRKRPPIVSRHFSTTLVCQRREVQATTEENTTIVQGITIPTDQTKQLQVGGKEQACPLCRLGVKVRYTDVLILRQFLTDDGELLPRKITGLCYEQHRDMRKSIKQAKRAGLLTEFRPEIGAEKTEHMCNWKWKRYNVYFEDEDREPI